MSKGWVIELCVQNMIGYFFVVQQLRIHLRVQATAHGVAEEPDTTQQLNNSNNIYICMYVYETELGFTGSSAGKESSCNTQDPSLIPGLERSPGEGKGYPLQYSWASLVAQMVNNLPAMQETQVQSLGQEDPLEKGMDTN